MLAFVFAFSLLGMPEPVSAQGCYPTVAVIYNPDTVAMWGWTTGTEVTLTIDNPANGPGIDYFTSKIIENPDRGFPLESLFDIQPGNVVTVTDGITTLRVTVTNVRILGANPELIY